MSLVKHRRRRGRTRLSVKNQATIPVAALRRAGLKPGDELRVEAAGAGRIVLTRVEETLAGYAGRPAPGTPPRPPAPGRARPRDRGRTRGHRAHLRSVVAPPAPPGPGRLTAPRTHHRPSFEAPRPASAARTRAGVIGSSVKRTP